MKQVWVIENEYGSFGAFNTAEEAKAAFKTECKEMDDPTPHWKKWRGEEMYTAELNCGGFTEKIIIKKFKVGVLT